MKPMKTLLTALTILCMSILLCTGVLAVETRDARFRDKTWEDVIAEFLAARAIDPAQVTIGYYNTVTGEEHYLNPDTLMYGASVAKLPTNMLYAERVSKGEMTMDTLVRGNKYSNLQWLSIVNSDNPAMETMVRDLGGGNYQEFRRQILPYIGESEETVTEDFLARNFFTSKQILYTLQLLYGNEETYPGVEACMMQASPYDYFKGNQPPYTIAHKYGWYTDRGTQYLNDSAIIYTDDPILLVMFTADVTDARYVLADFCSLMCDYAQYTRTQRFLTEALETKDLTIPTTAEFLSASIPSETPSGYATWQFGFLGAGFLVLIIALILLFKKKWLTLLMLLISALLIVIGGGPTELAFWAVREGYPQETVENFSDAFQTDSRGIRLLDTCDSAMAHTDSTLLPDLILTKTAESFKLTPGKALRSGNYITVDVTATKVDLPAVAEALEVQWQSAFDAAIAAATVSELYGEDGSFNTAITDAVMEQTINAVMEDWDSFLYTEDATLHLTLAFDGFYPTWKIICNEALLDLVNYA